jgi:fermentation-respiration switch protein FrsA (DUF1100 family)
MKSYRGLLAALAVVVALVAAPSAQAAIPSVFGGTIECKVQPSFGNVRLCGGFAENPADSANSFTLTWDHETKIDINVILPPAGGSETNYPLIGDFHGWGGSKQGLSTVSPGAPLTFEQKDARIQHWAEEGYAVFSMSDRGWGLSCGKFDPGKAAANCKKGYNHLMDDRYEVRDAQYLMSVLAAEGIVNPRKIGVTGMSYGGGISMALAALRNREMLPTGELVPWESPTGQQMEIAAAAPQWPWSDLSYALAPNGRNLDYVTNSPYKGPSGKLPIGVWKASWSKGLYLLGEALSNYEPKDPEANIPGWILRLEAGDPYSDASINGIVNQLSTLHSSFGIDHSIEPSPLLIQNGWNDDLFPVDESLRYYQRTRAQYPGDPISLFLADIGHARSQNKPADIAAFNARLEAWFAHYLKGEGAAPNSSVEALTTTCPLSAPSAGPFKAADWAGLQPGEINLKTTGSETITPGTPGEETPSSKAFNPLTAAGASQEPCVTLPEAEVENEHSIEYGLKPAPAGGFTLMGSPTIIADIESPSPNSEIAARLLDVSPEGTERLVARGLYRPDGGSQKMVFQLHPQGYHFDAGHEAVVELLPSDFSYGRFSNLQNDVTVSDLELRLPVLQGPGSLGGLVQTPQAKVVPAGYQLAGEFETKPSGGGGGGGGTKPPATTPPAVIKVGNGTLAGSLSVNRSNLSVPLECDREGACSGTISFAVKRKGKKGLTTLAKGSYSMNADNKVTVRVPLNKAGKNLIKELLAQSKPPKALNGQFALSDSGQAKSQTSQRAAKLPRAAH